MSEEELLKMYGGESNIFKLLLVELKEGTFSDCDEEFQYCCYKVITNLQQELTKYKERNEKLKDKIQKVIEKLDDLENNYGCGENEFVFAKDEVLKILEDKEKK
jgi:uncharacterized coiled-coil protein SlyX